MGVYLALADSGIEIMTSQANATSSNSGISELDVPEYRSLCGLSVVALLLGLASPLALLGPVLEIVPLAGVAVALMALAKIAASGDGLTGAAFARCGLVLAIVFGVALPVRALVRNELLIRQVDPIARDWMAQLAEDRFDVATDRLTAAAKARLQPPSDTPPTPDTPPPSLSETIAALQSDRLTQALSDLAEQGELNFVHYGTAITQGRNEYGVRMEYLVSHTDQADADSGALIVDIELLRSQRARAPDVGWQINGWHVEPSSSSGETTP